MKMMIMSLVGGHNNDAAVRLVVGEDWTVMWRGVEVRSD